MSSPGLAAARWADGAGERQDVAWTHRPDDLSRFSRGHGPGEPVRLVSRLAAAGVAEGLSIESRKPEWLRPMVKHGPEVLTLRRTLRELDLVTVCEDAGCPNLSECWADGTATFMVLGDRCTRACGFCLVDTRKPVAADTDEPSRVAEAVDRMGLDHAVLTMVARDDLDDGGMAHVAACVEAIRLRRPTTRVETLISDVKGDRRLARRAVRSAPRCAQPQHRDGRQAPARGTSVGRLCPQPVGAGAGEGRRARDQVEPDRRDGRDAMPRSSAASPISPGSVSTSSRSVNTSGRRHTTSQSRGGSSRRSSSGGRRSASSSASATSRPARSPARATTPRPPPNTPHLFASVDFVFVSPTSARVAGSGDTNSGDAWIGGGRASTMRW